MKAKIKKGHKLLFTKGCSNDWRNLKDYMIINFSEKYTYESFKKWKNHLIISTSKGDIDIVFCGFSPRLEFESFCKDQLILKIQ